MRAMQWNVFWNDEPIEIAGDPGDTGDFRQAAGVADAVSVSMGDGPERPGLVRNGQEQRNQDLETQRREVLQILQERRGEDWEF